MNIVKKIIINESMINNYNDNGYIILPKILNAKTIHMLNNEFENVFNGINQFNKYPYKNVNDYKEYSLNKYDNAWWVNKLIQKIVLSSEIGEIAAKLMDSQSVQIWHDQLLIKKPYQNIEMGVDNRVGWHQDYAYWNCVSNTKMITANISLQDTDTNNGCVNFIEGSHKNGILGDGGEFFGQDMNKLKNNFKKYINNWIEKPAILKAGEISFHNCLTIHGSEKNLSDNSRKSIVIHYMPGNSKIKFNGYPHTNVRMHGPYVKEGDNFDTSRHPIVWQK